jgi:hypothetical protein
MSDMTYLDAEEIRGLGLLQEMNRQILHPLGLAMEIDLDSGSMRMQDLRDDPVGVIFDELDLDKRVAFRQFVRSRSVARIAELGYYRQEYPKGTHAKLCDTRT